MYGAKQLIGRQVPASAVFLLGVKQKFAVWATAECGLAIPITFGADDHAVHWQHCARNHSSDEAQGAVEALSEGRGSGPEAGVNRISVYLQSLGIVTANAIRFFAVKAGVRRDRQSNADSAGHLLLPDTRVKALAFVAMLRPLKAFAHASAYSVTSASVPRRSPAICESPPTLEPGALDHPPMRIIDVAIAR